MAVSKNGEGKVTAQGWNDGSDGAGGAFRGAHIDVPQDVAFLAVGKITWGPFGTANSDVFEIYLPGPDLVLPTLPATKVLGNFDQLGTANTANAFDTISFTGGNKISLIPEVDEIRFGATYASVVPANTDPLTLEPSGFVDNKSGGLVLKSDTLVYTVTFNKVMNPGLDTLLCSLFSIPNAKRREDSSHDGH